jgi:hypothetical protein
MRVTKIYSVELLSKEESLQGGRKISRNCHE